MLWPRDMEDCTLLPDQSPLAVFHSVRYVTFFSSSLCSDISLSFVQPELNSPQCHFLGATLVPETLRLLQSSPPAHGLSSVSLGLRPRLQHWPCCYVIQAYAILQSGCKPEVLEVTCCSRWLVNIEPSRRLLWKLFGKMWLMIRWTVCLLLLLKPVKRRVENIFPMDKKPSVPFFALL